ncbi:MAG: glycosyltransferase family 4 protein [Sedimentisphaerales bacterium]|nr:glycosyltransferase family 4 protein [Sedimentisphaerales bacterium]
MHILYIHQHFAVPEGSTGTRSYEFARRWVEAGHKVTTVTGYYDIGGLTSGRKFRRRLDIEGINVVIVGTKYGNKQSFIRRIVSFLSFCILSVFAGLRTKNVDIIYATSTPLTVGVTAIILKWLKKVPYVFEVRDQWPEIPIELGIIKNIIAKNLLLRLEKTIYKRSSAIVALSPGMANGIKKIIDDRPVEVVPNCCDVDVFTPDIDGSAIRQKHKWGDKLVLLHFGAMGRANGLDFVIDAADRLEDNPDIHFVLAGGGGAKKKLTERIVKLGLNNIEIIDSMPKRELATLVAACDVAMVIFANYSILENNSANKFFDSLSAGKPVLLNYSGWQREILEHNYAGFGCDLCNLEQFVEKVLYLNSHRKQLARMGQNARRMATEDFDRDKLAAQVLSLLEEQRKKNKN